LHGRLAFVALEANYLVYNANNDAGEKSAKEEAKEEQTASFAKLGA